MQLVTQLAQKSFHFIYPQTDTWYRFNTSRRYDFFFLRVDGVSQLVEPCGALDVTVNVQAMRELHTDHALVGLSCLVGKRSPGMKRADKSFPVKSGCKRSQVQLDVLQQHVCQLQRCIHGNLDQQWKALKKLNILVCYPRPSLKYRDGDFLKFLCQQRKEAGDLQTRGLLGRLILAKRTAEKQSWWKHLEHLAGSGDSEAIRYLRRRTRSKADTSGLVATHSGKEGAASAIRIHFSHVFSSASPEEISACDASHMLLLQRARTEDVCPFTQEEIRDHMSRYTRQNKTSGMSGIPNELFLALQHDDMGMSFLTQHLNLVLDEPDEAPEDYCVAFVCLVPKKCSVNIPKDYRPISLLETTLKLFSGLIFRRWVHHCHIPRAQLGALPGKQALTCLYTAQQLLYLEYRTGDPGLWLLLDIQMAFDSLKRSKLLEYLARGPQGMSREAAALYHLLGSSCTSSGMCIIGKVTLAQAFSKGRRPQLDYLLSSWAKSWMPCSRRGVWGRGFAVVMWM